MVELHPDGPVRAISLGLVAIANRNARTSGGLDWAFFLRGSSFHVAVKPLGTDGAPKTPLDFPNRHAIHI